MTTLATTFWNGHHTTKGEGDCTWRGPLIHLPPPTAISAEEAAEAMHQDGCVQFPDVLSPDEVARLRAWMDGLGGPDSQYEVKNWCFNKHITGKVHEDPMWLTLMERTPIYECLALLLNKHFRFGGGNVWVTGAGREMGIHVDHQDISLPEEYLMDPRVRVPIHHCTLHYYLDDQVEEIGPTLVIPGSWRAGRYPVNESTWKGHEPRMISIKAGGAMLFRSDLWHGAARNRSHRRRYLIQLFFGTHRTGGYFPPLRCEERYRPEVLQALTPRTRILLGAEPGSVAAY